RRDEQPCTSRRVCRSRAVPFKQAEANTKSGTAPDLEHHPCHFKNTRNYIQLQHYAPDAKRARSVSAVSVRRALRILFIVGTLLAATFATPGRVPRGALEPFCEERAVDMGRAISKVPAPKV